MLFNIIVMNIIPSIIECESRWAWVKRIAIWGNKHREKPAISGYLGYQPKWIKLSHSCIQNTMRVFLKLSHHKPSLALFCSVFSPKNSPYHLTTHHRNREIGSGCCMASSGMCQPLSITGAYPDYHYDIISRHCPYSANPVP